MIIPALADIQREIERRKVTNDFYEYRKWLDPSLKDGWWQRDIARELSDFKDKFEAGAAPRLVIQAPPQHGKQIADSFQVLTPNGWKNHGDLVVGDYVYHPSGRPIKVLALSEKVMSNAKVHLSNGEVVPCHERHEWTVYNRNKKRYETLETAEMLKVGRRSGDRHPLYTGEVGKRGCHYTYKLPPVEPLQGEAKILPVDPYVLGAWLGDGKQTSPNLTYQPSDRAIVDRMVERGVVEGATSIHAVTGVHTTGFIGMRDSLRDAGVLAEAYGIRKKHIPEVYLTASIEQRLDLLAGLIDTDGYTYHKNGRVVFTTADEPLADTFCQLLSTFGWSFSKVKEQPKTSSSGIVGNKPYYVIGFNPTLAIPCALERKRNVPSKSRRMVAITDIELGDTGEMGRCIQVDSPDGLYLVGKTMQPTHNSVQIIDFISWIIGIDPSVRCIYSSFSERLGVRANLKLQRILSSQKYSSVFNGTRINSSNVATQAGQHLRNREIIEIVGTGGYFRNTTVRGAITGESLDLGIIDDPIKGREEANSQTIRDKTWDWMMDDFFTRFSERGALLCILTRWHIDDPIGRLIARDKSVRVLSYKAIAEHDEENRRAGEALFPEHKSIEFLQQRKELMAPANWEALYQQNPIVSGGNLFKTENLQEYDELPPLQWRALYVDTAQKTGERNDYSVIQHWGRTRDGRAYLIDQMRAKFEAPELEAAALAMWMKARAYDIGKYGSLRKMAIEDKVSGTGLIQTLKRKAIPIVAIQRNKDKYTRALDVVPYVAAGLVNVPRNAVWLKDYVSEMAAFPEGAHDDQCLVAGTLIETINGPVPIENISAGDMVLTRSGYKTVLWSGMTNESADVMTVKFSSGELVTGTRGHPVFVEGEGFVRLDKLVDLDGGKECQRLCQNTWLMRSSSWEEADQGHARANVEGFLFHDRKEPVYNLTVDECPEFYANGILVHNCDPTMDALLEMCGVGLYTLDNL